MIAKEKDKVKMLQFTTAAPLKRVKKKGYRFVLLELCVTATNTSKPLLPINYYY